MFIAYLYGVLGQITAVDWCTGFGGGFALQSLCSCGNSSGNV